MRIAIIDQSFRISQDNRQRGTAGAFSVNIAASFVGFCLPAGRTGLAVGSGASGMGVLADAFIVGAGLHRHYAGQVCLLIRQRYRLIVLVIVAVSRFKMFFQRGQDTLNTLKRSSGKYDWFRPYIKSGIPARASECTAFYGQSCSALCNECAGGLANHCAAALAVLDCYRIN